MNYKNPDILLKYQKTIAKLIEFNIDKNSYPKINSDYKKLSFPTICYISEASESIINGNDLTEDQKEDISFCCEYYDAAFKSRNSLNESVDFMLEAIVSFVLNEDFGSAKAFFEKYGKPKLDLNDKRVLLLNILTYLFSNNKPLCCDELGIKILDYIKNDDLEGFNIFISDFCKTIYLNNDYIDAFYLECTLAISKLSIINSSKRLIPLYSNIELKYWLPYFSNKYAIKMLWPAQKLICSNNFLSGKSGLIQLPTGVGKTKSMELIIESSFLAKRSRCCLIVAPLRALCNQISEDLYITFDKKIKKISDVLEDDYLQYFENNEEKIVVCTPEKFLFMIHHNIELIDSIDLMIFDECHMFDDPTRGIMFELLLSIIKEKKKDHQQIVLISAVLSNARDIASWFFKDSNAVAFDDKIKSTPKSIGFINSNSQIYYYSKNLNEYDFFLPNVYERNKLTVRKGAKEKYFPDNTSTDYALYLANKLCKNGGIAIYVSRRDSINATIKRLADVYKKGFRFCNLYSNRNENEMGKFITYFDEVYGIQNEYSKGALFGVLPHYSSLGIGIRNSIEYSFKNNNNSVIVCTSTLSQGVNVPIKYLILSSTKNGQSSMTTRNFQNLIGRTARSGSFTEGSIIISDPNNFDDKDTGKFGANRWNDVINKFNSKNTEPCISSIIKMFREHTDIMNSYIIYGDKIVDFIINNLDNDWKQMLEDALTEELSKKIQYNSLISLNIKELVDFYYSTITQLETNVCFEISNLEFDSMSLDTYINAKLEYLFAYFLANKEEKNKLFILLKTLANRILNSNIDYIKVGRSLSNIDNAKLISSIIEHYHLDSIVFNEDELLKLIIDEINLNLKRNYSFQVCCDWIKGLPYCKIFNSNNIDVFKIEKICSQDISYNLSFFIGNMIDFLNDENVNKSKLTLLQKKIKYGVNDLSSILFCEEIINDRHIAKLISDIIGDSIDNKETLRSTMKNSREAILNKLEGYPSYYRNKMRLILQDN